MGQMEKSRRIKVAAIQESFTTNSERNIRVMNEHLEEAAKSGAQIVLLPELFENIYFCTFERDSYFALAKPVDGNPTIEFFQQRARELKVVIPLSFFEKEG
ncbi:MAG: hypothetical protein KDD35_11725, partial [Bdellovibrionales bacterium]|nr:hypothetical protein [Bdellovibrionales bacterium]